jgi:hypothetical protein
MKHLLISNMPAPLKAEQSYIFNYAIATKNSRFNGEVGPAFRCV